ncbi:hypothetical protein [Streptomyces sp. AC550_RSS872]|uniref:hypothetical protein n=1 Tax=Streptomyces sp. AC550_RSS872 TaxID=2823689 RepID=UPI001C279DDF|nr:hypothetical protein [Streptomyces sp. AC550_RSS872]
MRPELTEDYIFKDSKAIVLERGFQWGSASGRNPVEREGITAHCAVRALASLCEGLIRPMTFGVTRQWVDDEYDWPADDRPPRWNWFVTTPQSPPDARSTYVDAQVIETATLDEESMHSAVDRVLDDPCAASEGDHLAWDELLIDHTWARLPEPDRHLEKGELRIDDYDNRLHRVPIPLERMNGRIWATKATVYYPFQLRVTNKSCGSQYPDAREYDEFIEMTISVNWSFWWNPGAGRAMLDQALHRVLRQGWRPACPPPGTPGGSGNDEAGSDAVT